LKRLRNFGIVLLLLLLVAVGVFYSQGFSIAGIEQANNDMLCTFVEECSNCKEYCSPYENCVVFNVEGKQVACFEGSEKVLKEPNFEGGTPNE
jgi:hypothetical protein